MHPPPRKSSLQTPPSQLESTLGLPPPNLHNHSPRHTYTYNKAWKKTLKCCYSDLANHNFVWSIIDEKERQKLIRRHRARSPSLFSFLCLARNWSCPWICLWQRYEMCLGGLSFQSSFFYLSFSFSTTAWQVSTSYFLQWGLEPRKGIPSCLVILAWVGVMLAIKSFPVNVTISSETSQFEFISIVS